MKLKLSALVIGCLLLSNFAVGQTYVSGNIGSATWTAAGNPYILTGDISLSFGDTLRIGPAVVVDFRSSSNQFDVTGVIVSVGTSLDSIRFVGVSTSGSIITFYDNNSASNFRYVHFSDVSLMNIGSPIMFAHCSISGEISLGSFPITLDSCQITGDIDAEGSTGNSLLNSDVSGQILNGTDWTVIGCNLEHSESGSFIGIYTSCVVSAEGSFIGNTLHAGAVNYFEGWAQAVGFINCTGNFEHNLITAYASSEYSAISAAFRQGSGISHHNSINTSHYGYSDFVGEISNNTIVDCPSGAIETDQDSLVVKNNIILGCYTGIDGPVEAQYCCIYNCTTPFAGGATPGPGVIYDNPLLINEWFLDPNSPCIDAGDPDPIYNDPDGTRDDMGANYFDQGAAYATVTLTPGGLPIQIPASGGSFDFNIAVANGGTSQVTGQVWTNILMPNGNVFGPIIGPIDLSLAPGWFGERDRTQNIPSNAPPGNYTYQAYVGIDEETIWDQDSFDFEKLTTGDGTGITDWANYGEPFEDWLIAGTPEMEIPTEWALMQNYPNPFNSTTTIAFSLPEASNVRLDVFDIAGRNVGAQHAAPLLDGFRDAGYHQVTFDASHLASGLYFYQIEAGDFSSVKKMILVK
ncbi:T9SS type A sorting domain-containing protein [bacterium]|nr:T9SS type A sorting domain-containing protein [bacterium]MBU1881281.1 T9SS type A sorting domain-containing protein [bacterium]